MCGTSVHARKLVWRFYLPPKPPASCMRSRVGFPTDSDDRSLRYQVCQLSAYTPLRGGHGTGNSIRDLPEHLPEPQAPTQVPSSAKSYLKLLRPSTPPPVHIYTSVPLLFHAYSSYYL